MSHCWRGCSLFLNALLPDRTCRLRRPVRFNRGLDRITVVDDHESCAPRCTRTATTVTAVVERATLQVLRRQLQDHVVRSLGGPLAQGAFSGELVRGVTQHMLLSIYYIIKSPSSRPHPKRPFHTEMSHGLGTGRIR